MTDLLPWLPPFAAACSILIVAVTLPGPAATLLQRLPSRPFRLVYDHARRGIEAAIGTFLTYVASRLATGRS